MSYAVAEKMFELINITNHILNNFPDWLQKTMESENLCFIFQKYMMNSIRSS